MVTTDITERKRQVRVVIYERLAHLRAASTRHSRRWDADAQEFSDTLGVCHTYRDTHVGADGVEADKPEVATIRLHRRNATPSLVAHEVMHAAAWLYALDCLEAGALAVDHFRADNELLAEVYAELFDAVWRAVAADAERV